MGSAASRPTGGRRPRLRKALGLEEPMIRLHTAPGESRRRAPVALAVPALRWEAVRVRLERIAGRAR